MNLRVYFERRWLAEASGKTDHESSTQQNTVPKAVPAEVEHAITIPHVMRSIVQPVLRMEGLPVLNILKSLKEKVPGFVYDYVIDKEGQLAGWCYMTPRQRAALEDSGHVIFCDFQAKATNKYGWPYFSPSVCNADNKNEVVMYGCCVSQSSEACAWVMQCLVKFVPPIVKICETLFTDDGLSEHVVGFYFPSTTHLICCFHVIDLDIFIVAKKVKYVHTEELRRNLWSKVIYCRTREAGDLYMRGLLERPMPIALKQRLQYWYSKFHKWGYIRHTFTAGFKGNTMGEVPFAAIRHWLTRVDDFRLLLEDLMERERTIHLARNLAASHSFMKWYAKPTDTKEVQLARDIFSDHCCKLYNKQLSLMPQYSISRTDDEGDSHVWVVRLENSDASAPLMRRVVWPSGNEFPGCDDGYHTCSGIPCACVHILVLFRFLGKPLFHASYFHPHWARQTSVRVVGPLLCDIVDPIQCSQNEPIATTQQQEESVTPALSQSSEVGSLSLFSPGSRYTDEMNSPGLMYDGKSPNIPRPFDKVNTGKLLEIFKTISDLVTRPPAKKKSLDQKFYDTLKIIKHQLMASGGPIRETQADAVTFQPPAKSTIRKLFSHESSLNPAQPSTPDNPNAQTATKRKKSIHERDPAAVKKVNIQAVTLDNLSPMEILEVSQTKAKHPNKHHRTCSFCSKAGCELRTCPRLSEFGNRVISGDLFLNTLSALEGICLHSLFLLTVLDVVKGCVIYFRFPNIGIYSAFPRGPSITKYVSYTCGYTLESREFIPPCCDS